MGIDTRDRFRGCLLGGAVGDALGARRGRRGQEAGAQTRIERDHPTAPARIEEVAHAGNLALGDQIGIDRVDVEDGVGPREAVLPGGVHEAAVQATASRTFADRVGMEEERTERRPHPLGCAFLQRAVSMEHADVPDVGATAALAADPSEPGIGRGILHVFDGDPREGALERLDGLSIAAADPGEKRESSFPPHGEDEVEPFPRPGSTGLLGAGGRKGGGNARRVGPRDRGRRAEGYALPHRDGVGCRARRRRARAIRIVGHRPRCRPWRRAGGPERCRRGEPERVASAEAQD
ncbi:MAG: hypothetical protein FJ033_08860 [Chloroflexi bacterium]|nr:hypothetical protein [Chloroflexota bacterium]